MTYPIQALSRAALLGCAATLAWSTHATAQPPLPARMSAGHGVTIVTPGSSQPGRPGTMHTHYKLLVRGNRPRDSMPSGTSETPASLACVYGLTAQVAGCNPETLTTVATGGSRTIAIVDAYDNPNAASDLAVYSQYFGLPKITKSNFKVVYAGGTQPPQDPTGEWEGEESLDVDMAHAAAPNATIILVEAQSPQKPDLYAAVRLAAKLVAKAGGGEVSTSWGADEYAGEEADDSNFVKQGVVFVNAAGDAPGDEVPAAFPDVIGVGGTLLDRSDSGDYTGQEVDGNSAGGLSDYILRPSYQNGIANLIGGSRGTPDVGLVDYSYANDTRGGVWVYDTTPYDGQVLDWAEFAGTSVGAPLEAGLINSAGAFLPSSRAELAAIYKKLGKPIGYVAFGEAVCINDLQLNGSYENGPGWNPCTGVGVPFAITK
jgi:subtilase family serine protease